MITDTCEQYKSSLFVLDRNTVIFMLYFCCYFVIEFHSITIFFVSALVTQKHVLFLRIWILFTNSKVYIDVDVDFDKQPVDYFVTLFLLVPDLLMGFPSILCSNFGCSFICCWMHSWCCNACLFMCVCIYLGDGVARRHVDECVQLETEAAVASASPFVAGVVASSSFSCSVSGAFSLLLVLATMVLRASVISFSSVLDFKCFSISLRTLTMSFWLFRKNRWN